MTTRIPCCVPFCRRTTAKGEDGDEMICRDHGRVVSKDTKRIWRHLRRKATKAMERDPERCSYDEITYTLRLAKLAERAWAKFKAEAIEAAAGMR